MGGKKREAAPGSKARGPKAFFEVTPETEVGADSPKDILVFRWKKLSPHRETLSAHGHTGIRADWGRAPQERDPSRVEQEQRPEPSHWDTMTSPLGSSGVHLHREWPLGLVSSAGHGDASRFPKEVGRLVLLPAEQWGRFGQAWMQAPTLPFHLCVILGQGLHCPCLGSLL